VKSKRPKIKSMRWSGRYAGRLGELGEVLDAACTTR
jgi:hypothetical protein